MMSAVTRATALGAVTSGTPFLQACAIPFLQSVPYSNTSWSTRLASEQLVRVAGTITSRRRSERRRSMVRDSSWYSQSAQACPSKPRVLAEDAHTLTALATVRLLGRAGRR